MARQLRRIESEKFQGFGCSECGWVFDPAGAPNGESVEEMKERYRAQRDREFAAHVCSKHPKVKSS